MGRPGRLPANLGHTWQHENWVGVITEFECENDQLVHILRRVKAKRSCLVSTEEERQLTCYLNFGFVVYEMTG